MFDGLFTESMYDFLQDFLGAFGVRTGAFFFID